MNQATVKSFMALVLLGGLAPAAQAMEISRNTGVGAEIAAQGNAALRHIRSVLHIATLKLPKAHAVKVSAPVSAPATSGGTVAAAGLRCAE